MRRWSLAFAALVWASLVTQIWGSEVKLTDENLKSQSTCSGMYSRKAWGGSSEAFILTKFVEHKPTGESPSSDPVVAVIVFEWADEHLIGVPKSNNTSQKEYICNQQSMEADLCTEEQYGQWILASNATLLSRNEIKTWAVHIASEDKPAINYSIDKTGFFCVYTRGLGNFKYTGIVEFKEAYGELPGSDIAKLPFYGGLTIVYAVVGIFWAFLYVQNRSDILPVQNYITATIVFLVLEMLVTWAYYDVMNRNGATVGSRVLMIIVSILNAARNSFSFFLLLIVCMGYGVVKTTLGKKMLYARILAITHFIFGVLYAVVFLAVSPEDVGPYVLLVILPLAGTLTAFYVWTLNSLAATMKDLADRKQKTKAQMYRRLWWAILTSVIVIFAFFFINSFTFAGQGDPDFMPGHWQTRWFVLDGWLNLVYLADVCFIAYLWRPTANNRRFAMSDEIAQDDEGFEIASVRGSIDDDDENRPYDAPLPEANGQAKPANDPRDRSPLPAPIPQRPASANVQAPRDSLDGETIFAVGEDGDKFSDSDGDDEERKGLTH